MLRTKTFLAVCLAMTLPAHAVMLTFEHSFEAVLVDPNDPSDTAGPEGLAFDSVNNQLMAVSSAGLVPGPDSRFQFFDPVAGRAIGSAVSIALGEVEGAYFSTTDSYYVVDSTADGGIYEIDSTGAVLGGPIDINPPSGDPDGVIFHVGTSTFLVADENDNSIYQFGPTGLLLATIPTTGIGFDEPEGIEFDPLTGNLFVADTAQGTSSIYELTMGGALVNIFDLNLLTGGVLLDAEGLAFDAETRTLYVAFDEEERIGVFSVTNVPEPSSVVLTVLGLLALTFRRRIRLYKS